MKIAINGFGRIGKLVFRAFLEKKLKNVEIVGINELGSLEYPEYLMTNKFLVVIFQDYCQLLLV